METRNSITPLEETLHTFMNTAAKSKVAVVVPMYGYWQDASGQLDDQTLKATMDRAFSNIHQLYFIFVAEEKRLSDKVGSALIGISKGGNFKGVAAKAGDSYGEYLRAGIECAIHETEASYVVVINPWQMLQYNGIDILIDRINKEDAKVVSGFDVKGTIDGEAFHEYKFNKPLEYKGLELSFFGMKKYTAEVINFDPNYKTHYFIGRDAWQTLFTKGFESMISQRIPIFTFDMDWHEFESESDFEQDRIYFESKWHYGLEDVKYN